MNKIWISK